MSDLKIFNIHTNSILRKYVKDRFFIRELIEKNSEEILGVTLVASDFSLPDSSEEKIDTLGYDENNQLTVIEYRTGKFTNTITKGLVFLDYIKNNLGKIKSLLSEKLGYELTNTLIFNPRLLCIGDDFNQYDQYAIQQIPFPIDLVRFQLFDKNLLLLEKNYQSQKIIRLGKPYPFSDQENYNLYRQLSEFIRSLGDEVCEVQSDYYFAYRKIRNFAYLLTEDGIELKLKGNNGYKSMKVKNQKDLDKALTAIEHCYDEN